MKLIYIYGPPASGKLTIATELSTLTGIPVFHNHLTRDIVKGIYGEDIDDHYELVDNLRRDVMGYCAKHGTSLIFTYVYEGSSDDENVKSFISAIEDHGGSVAFVEVGASVEDLIARVDNDSRKVFRKLTSKSVMREITADMSKYSMNFVEPLHINSSELSAEAAAAKIAEVLELARL
jgi:adenylylsulfate kinase-like enzyme